MSNPIKPSNKENKSPTNNTKPLKATDRMAPQFSGYAEGRKPNVGGDAKKRPNADHKKNVKKGI
jgi:hypothetical protein